ncbi:unnamed protein product [Polarella glacialis]|uniref:Peptide deformylase n=1 Tax=Polarella glacialis TaxID=89957 RepID=A0A813JAQ0_POLGL|nr:unnamed protein product [Polarella glacialis]
MLTHCAAASSGRRRGSRLRTAGLVAPVLLVGTFLASLSDSFVLAFVAGSQPSAARQPALLQASGSNSLVARRFFGDLFGKKEEPQEEALDFPEEPGRGGEYSPPGFDTRNMRFEVVRYPHPALRLPNAAVVDFDARLKKFSDNLFRTMYATGEGIGLAAPQVGVNLRIMVYNSDPSTKEDETVFVNPKILASSENLCIESESCLSFPRIKGNVHRPTWIEVEAADWTGTIFQRRIEGFEARLFQHEYDHLEGIVYTDRLGQGSLEKVQKDLDFFIEVRARLWYHSWLGKGETWTALIPGLCQE